MKRNHKRTLNEKEIEAKNAAMEQNITTTDNTGLIGHTVKVRMTDRKNPLYHWNSLYLPMKITAESDMAYTGYVPGIWNPKNLKKEAAYTMTVHKSDLLTGKMIMEDAGCLDCDSCSRHHTKTDQNHAVCISSGQSSVGEDCPECICGLNSGSMMTLHELKEKVSPAKDVPKPKVQELLEKETPVATYRGLGYWLNVYRNGFVVVGKGRFATVFRLDECVGYSYFSPTDMTVEELEKTLIKARNEDDMEFSMQDYLDRRTEEEELSDYLEMMEILESTEEEHRYEEKFFLNLRWEVRVLIEAEDQLKRNVPLYRVRDYVI